MAAAIVNIGVCATQLLRCHMPAETKLKSFQPTLSRRSVATYGSRRYFKINSTLSKKDYLVQWQESMQVDNKGGPLRWISPLERGSTSTDSPLLFFLPGIDGSGDGLKLHHAKLGEIFDIRCLHIPATDRTPLVDLVKMVENTVKMEQDPSVKRPIYLVGESHGASLALLVAAHNPDIDFILILANPATNFSKSLVQSVAPLSSMISNRLDAGLLYWMSSLPETVMWKLRMIEEMQKELDSNLHNVKAQTLILTSGNDSIMRSTAEGEKLTNILQNSKARSYTGNGDPLFSDEKFDLVAAIKGAGYFRRGATVDYFTDFLPPSPSELEMVQEPFRWMDVAVDPVILSTTGGKVVRGLAGIPTEGPVLFVSNHMLLGQDLVPLVSRFWKENIKLRGLAHPLFFDRMKDTKFGLEPKLFEAVKIAGSVPVSAKNIYRMLSLNSHVLLYPGGAREALHRRGEEYKLFWPDEPEFVRMAARFGAKIVPFGSVGEDDLYQYILDCDDQMMIPPLKAQIEALTREIPRLRSDAEGEVGKQIIFNPITMPKLPGRFYYFFGEPISTEGRKDVLTDKDKATKLYLEVKTDTEKCIEYLKDRREKDPYRNILARLAYQSYHGFHTQVPTFEI